MLSDKRKNKAPSVLRRAIARFTAHEEDQAAAAAAAEIAARPSRFTRHRCAVTGERWLTEWRASADGIYRRHRKIRGEEAVEDTLRASRAGTGGHGGAPAATGGKFDRVEFDWNHDPCEGCGDTRLFIHCHCGEIVCSGRTIFYKKADPFFSCDKRCGKRFELNGRRNVRQIAASAGPAKTRKALPKGAKPKALPGSRRALSRK